MVSEVASGSALVQSLISFTSVAGECSLCSAPAEAEQSIVCLPCGDASDTLLWGEPGGRVAKRKQWEHEEQGGMAGIRVSQQTGTLQQGYGQ